LKNKAKNLSDLFASIEGRRPRILIGGEKLSVLKKINALANAFADLGCNVDIAPLHSDMPQLAQQCAENDVDIVLIIAHEKIKESTLKKFQEIVLGQNQEMILSLYNNDTDSLSLDDTKLNHWILFNQKSNPAGLVQELLSSLMRHSE